MSRNPVDSYRKLLFGGIFLFAIVSFAAVSATFVKVSLSAVVLVIVAFAEAGLIILGLMMVQSRQAGSVKNQENFAGKSLGEMPSSERRGQGKIDHSRLATLENILFKWRRRDYGMEFARVVRKRRMIRAFKAVPVPEAKICRILELAQHYPSAGFSQGMAFILVTEPERIRRLKEQNRLRGDAPVLVVPCVSEKLYHDRYHEPDKIRQDGTEINWPIPYWYFDAGCASLLVLLAAVDEGLSAYLAGAFRPDLLRKELEIPDHFVPVGVISIGYPDLERHVPSPSLNRGRRPTGDVVHSQHW